MNAARWSRWRPFPDPRTGGMLVAPFGPGCYELRNGNQLVLYGSAGHTAERMTSLLPKPIGAGIRNNSGKRQYVLDHLPQIKYRTVACNDRAAAFACEAELRKKKSKKYIFSH